MNEEEKGRGLRFPSASRWAGTPRRVLAFGMVARPSGLRRESGNVVALDGLDLVVKKGTFFGFLGPNGAGHHVRYAG